MEDYPKTYAELEKSFATDEACREYLYGFRWPNGFLCPKCGGKKMSVTAEGLYLCLACNRKTSVIQGTIFQDSHLPLIIWLRAIWHICSEKSGASALGLKRALGLGSYRTAWLMLHKLRKAMVRPGRGRLSGEIEVDETYIGGVKKEKRGRGALGKTLVLIAAEKDGRGVGRIRMMCVPSFSSEDLRNAIRASISDRATIITDGLQSYKSLPQYGYIHSIEMDDEALEECRLSRCHLVASLLKRWIVGTLQGSVSREYLQDYLNEFTFRFNRRKSNSRGLLFYRLIQYAMQTEASTYEEIKNHKG